MGMCTWGEAAAFRSLEHFREIKGDFFLLQVDQTEAAEAWGVDDEAAGIKGVHFVESRGMLALKMDVGDLAHARVQRRIECLDKRRLADSGNA